MINNMKTHNMSNQNSLPIFLAGIGATVGIIVTIVAALAPKVNDSQFNSMLNLATTAITAGLSGAAGIAQANSNQIENIEKVQITEEEKIETK